MPGAAKTGFVTGSGQGLGSRLRAWAVGPQIPDGIA